MFALAILAAFLLFSPASPAAPLRAGVARADITDREAGPVNDPSFVKALVLTDGSATAVLVTVDAVALAGIGRIPDSYMAGVRDRLRRELGVAPENVLVNASHCHSVVRRDAADLTVQAVKEAWASLVPVKAGAGRGHEDRVMENRRLKLKDGSEADVRRAYSLPRDGDVAAIGPVDPEIGLVRLDRLDGRPLAAIYHFSMHPIQGVPGGGNTADITGFASKVIEDNLGGGAIVFFLQGCAGDINPANYKDVHAPHDAEPAGNLLGLSALRGLRAIRTAEEATLRVSNDVISLPRAADFDRRITSIRAEQAELLRSLTGTTLDFKTFLPLYVQYRLSPEFPSSHSHRYAHEKARGRNDLVRLDEDNRGHLDAYLRNIHTMERLTRLGTNLDLLLKHQAELEAAGSKTLEVEVGGLRVGDFRLVTFPGELTVEVGLNIKKRSPPLSYVSGYTNGYIYYTATSAQRNNTGYAQEDCDVMVAPEWQAVFEEKAVSVLHRLGR